MLSGRGKGTETRLPKAQCLPDGKAWRWQQRSGFWADTSVVLPTVPPAHLAGAPVLCSRGLLIC